MCKQEIIQKIDNGEAIVISKIRLYVWLLVIFAGIIVAFTTTKLQAMSNAKRVTKIENTTCNQTDEMYFNLKHLFEVNGWVWIEKKE